MKKCLRCDVPILRAKFCSPKCAAKQRSQEKFLIKKKVLERDYLQRKMKLAAISRKHKVSIATICKYLNEYGIQSRPRYIDFKDQQIGRLKVIGPIEINHKGGGKHIKWQCVCNCGNDFIAYSNYLSRAVNAKCGKCGIGARRSALELKEFMWGYIKRSAAHRNLEFSITRDWAYQLFLKQNRKCALSGVGIKFAETAGRHKLGDTTASLDRKDPKIGYTQGNVQWVHKTLNIMKGPLGLEEFKDWCVKVAQ